MKLLHIDTSILDQGSVSRQLTAAIVERLKELSPSTEIIYHDFVVNPLGHLAAAEFLAFRGEAPADLGARQAIALNANLLDEFLAADILVVGAPMYNFSLPSQLKAWLDRLAVGGKTFRYTEKGVEGLAGGKRVIVASTRGGLYGEHTPTAFLDHQENYLKGFFGFLGVTDVTIVRAEGLALGDESRKRAIDAAVAMVQTLVL